ncbi:exosortase A [Roseomonas sp. CCTCC AB2023176]|uniref:exosortase A n=1 Tax=Roseomonas sp. CCTCC AB2023176 TaxID=3342640 RepID=UPI0035D59A84
MSTTHAPPALADNTEAREGWRIALPILLLGMAALGWLFRTEVAAAVRTWEASTAYNHCWLVLPVAAWLAWQRRDRFAVLRPQPQPLVALLGLAPALAWFAAERMGIMEGQQFAALGLLYVLLLAVLGWRVCRAMAVPLAYLVFLVPFGAFTVPLLQSITARLVDFGLNFTGISHYVDELIIEVPAGVFYVAEACAGLRFVIAALAFGALYAAVMFRSPWRRAAVMVIAVVVPILANGIRALGLVVIGQYQGSAAAIEADHVTYGWVFFSIVLLLMILAGLPFRQDGAPPRVTRPTPPGPSPRPVAVATAAALAISLAAVGPAAARALDRAGAAPPQRSPLALPDIPGCASRPDGTLDCGGVTVSAAILAFHPSTNWRAVVAARREAAGGEEDEDVTFSVSMLGGAWRGRVAHARRGTPASAWGVATWLDGHPAGDGLRTRARQALRPFQDSPGRPVLAVIEVRPRDQADATRDGSVLRNVLERHGPALAAAAAAASGGRGGS